jgi:hypothetical protein
MWWKINWEILHVKIIFSHTIMSKVKESLQLSYFSFLLKYFLNLIIWKSKHKKTYKSWNTKICIFLPWQPSYLSTYTFLPSLFMFDDGSCLICICISLTYEYLSPLYTTSIQTTQSGNMPHFLLDEVYATLSRFILLDLGIRLSWGDGKIDYYLALNKSLWSRERNIMMMLKKPWRSKNLLWNS